MAWLWFTDSVQEKCCHTKHSWPHEIATLVKQEERTVRDSAKETCLALEANQQGLRELVQSWTSTESGNWSMRSADGVAPLAELLLGVDTASSMEGEELEKVRKQVRILLDAVKECTEKNRPGHGQRTDETGRP
eukprot:SAG11_NODE_7559_length_1129_cov_1.299029_1_plen_133_part_10